MYIVLTMLTGLLVLIIKDAFGWKAAIALWLLMCGVALMIGATL